MDSEGNGNFPLEIRPLNEKERAELKTENEILNNLIHVGPHGYLLFNEYKDTPEQFRNLKLRSDDVFVLGFPKSGNHWTQELVWMVANDFDYKTATSVRLLKRYSFVGLELEVMKAFIKNGYEEDTSKLDRMVKFMIRRRIDEMPSPRFLKSHLPFSLLPPSILEEAKVVYVARDPRDVAVSFSYYVRAMRPFDVHVEFKDFWKLFKNNLVWCSPYFAHFQEAWKLKDHPNMLFLFYEELSEDMPDVIRRVAKFLGKPAVTEEQIVGLCEHLKFDSFRNNKMVNYDIPKEKGMFAKDQYFVRKGKVGGWRNYFDEEMAKEAEQWMEEGLRGIDYKFKN